MIKIAILQKRSLDSPISVFHPVILQILFVTLTTLSQTPSHPFLSAHTRPQNDRPTGDTAQNPPFVLGQRQRKNFFAQP